MGPGKVRSNIGITASSLDFRGAGYGITSQMAGNDNKKSKIDIAPKKITNKKGVKSWLRT
jgi:hypothetical protein